MNLGTNDGQRDVRAWIWAGIAIAVILLALMAWRFVAPNLAAVPPDSVVDLFDRGCSYDPRRPLQIKLDDGQPMRPVGCEQAREIDPARIRSARVVTWEGGLVLTTTVWCDYDSTLTHSIRCRQATDAP